MINFWFPEEPVVDEFLVPERNYICEKFFSTVRNWNFYVNPSELPN